MKSSKKILCAAVTLFAAAAAFAAGPYKVESVTGKVTYESAPGKWATVEVGQELSASTVVQTSVNSTLVVSNNGTKATVKAMQKGTVESLSSATKVAKVTVGNKVDSSKVSADGKTAKSTVTASSRASEAKEDVDWDE